MAQTILLHQKLGSQPLSQRQIVEMGQINIPQMRPNKWETLHRAEND
jgi:hypothetical protein